MKLTIDRFEGDLAVCLDDKKLVKNLEINSLPKGCKPGDTIVIDESGLISVDKATTEKRAKEIENLMKDLFKE